MKVTWWSLAVPALPGSVSRLRLNLGSCKVSENPVEAAVLSGGPNQGFPDVRVLINEVLDFPLVGVTGDEYEWFPKPSLDF